MPWGLPMIRPPQCAPLITRAGMPLRPAGAGGIADGARSGPPRLGSVPGENQVTIASEADRLLDIRRRQAAELPNARSPGARAARPVTAAWDPATALHPAAALH